MRGLITKMVRYVFTGGLAAIVDAGGFALLVMAKFAVAAAAATSFCMAAVVNYRLTRRVVFRQSVTGRGFALFLLAALIGLLVNVSVTLSAIAVLGLPPLAAKIAGIGTAFLSILP